MGGRALLLSTATLAVAAAGCSGEQRASPSSPTGAVPIETYLLHADLSALQVVPPPKGGAGASARFNGRLGFGAAAGGMLRWTLSVSNTSGAIRAAHLHIGAPGKRGPVVLSLCPPPRCTSSISGTRTGLTRDSRLVWALLHRRVYVDVHTRRNPGGELRGRIRVAVLANATG